MRLDDLLAEYDLARAFTDSLVAPLDDGALTWRPHADSSAIGWHLGHQAAVNHYLMRNLTAAEPSLNPLFDRFFDSAGPEAARGDLPPVDEIIDYRQAVATRTHDVLARIRAGRTGAPDQLRTVAALVLATLVNHEYQHDCWIAEVIETQGLASGTRPRSDRLQNVDGYWVLDLGVTALGPEPRSGSGGGSA